MAYAIKRGDFHRSHPIGKAESIAAARATIATAYGEIIDMTEDRDHPDHWDCATIKGARIETFTIEPIAA